MSTVSISLQWEGPVADNEGIRVANTGDEVEDVWIEDAFLEHGSRDLGSFVCQLSSGESKVFSPSITGRREGMLGTCMMWKPCPEPPWEFQIRTGF